MLASNKGSRGGDSGNGPNSTTNPAVTGRGRDEFIGIHRHADDVFEAAVTPSRVVGTISRIDLLSNLSHMIGPIDKRIEGAFARLGSLNILQDGAMEFSYSTDKRTLYPLAQAAVMGFTHPPHHTIPDCGLCAFSAGTNLYLAYADAKAGVLVLEQVKNINEEGSGSWERFMRSLGRATENAERLRNENISFRFCAIMNGSEQTIS